MSTSEEGWYIAEPDGTTFGPMTRAALNAAFSRGRHSSAALGWHVDLSEWRPLASLARGVSTVDSRATDISERSEALADTDAARRQEQARLAATLAMAEQAATDQARKALEKRARREARKGAGGDSIPDDGRRLLSSAPAASAAAARAGTTSSTSTSTSTSKSKSTASATATTSASTGAKAVGDALRRLLARAIDLLTLGVLGAAALWGLARFVVDHLAPDSPLPPAPFFALVFLAVFALAPLEIIALALFGATLGKVLLGISVRRRDGGRPGLAAATSRSVGVLGRGLALGIPVFLPFTLIAAGVALINAGSTPWDQANGLVTRTDPMSGRRFQVAGGALIVLWVALTSGWLAQVAAEVESQVWLWLQTL